MNIDCEQQEYDREAQEIFERFPDFIREYIYRHNWDSLRAVQLAAAKTLSNYGISIKISNDGIMTGFKMDRNKLRARAIFII